MPIPQWLGRIQDAWISRLVSESTWGYPIVGALHVLAIALCGGAILATNLQALGLAFGDRKFSQLNAEVRLLKQVGFVAVVLTGSLLFASGAAYYYNSTAFRAKILLLCLILLNAVIARGRRRALNAGISLALWAAVIFASRGIAFF